MGLKVSLDGTLRCYQGLGVVRESVGPRGVFMSEFNSFGLKSFKVTHRLRQAVDKFSGGNACSCVTPRVCGNRGCSDEMSVCSLKVILCELVGRGELPFVDLRGRFVACESGRGTLGGHITKRRVDTPISTKARFTHVVVGTYTCSPTRECRAPRRLCDTLSSLGGKESNEVQRLRGNIRGTKASGARSCDTVTRGNETTRGIASSTRGMQGDAIRGASMRGAQKGGGASSFRGTTGEGHTMGGIPTDDFASGRAVSIMTRRGVRPRRAPSRAITVESTHTIRTEGQEHEGGRLLHETLLTVITNATVLVVTTICCEMDGSRTRRKRRSGPVTVLSSRGCDSAGSKSGSFSGTLSAVGRRTAAVASGLGDCS